MRYDRNVIIKLRHVLTSNKMQYFFEPLPEDHEPKLCQECFKEPATNVQGITTDSLYRRYYCTVCRDKELYRNEINEFAKLDKLQRQQNRNYVIVANPGRRVMTGKNTPNVIINDNGTENSGATGGEPESSEPSSPAASAAS
jgi:hypothetical protein